MYNEKASRPYSSIAYWVTYFLLNVKVQPDLEELTTNMEDNEGAETKEEEKLGKLQFSMDYDFQKSEVSSFLIILQNCWQLGL